MTQNQEAVQLAKNEQAEKADNVANKTSKKMPVWCRLLRGGICLLFITVLLLILFLCTGYGQRKAIEWVDSFIEPLQIEKVEGSLQDGFSLTNAQFKQAGVNANIGKAYLHIGFRCLIDYEVCLNNFKVKDASIVVDTSQLPPKKEEKEEEPFTELNLPMSISVKNIELDNIDVKVDDMDIHLNHFQTALSGKGRTVHISPTHLDGLDVLLASKVDAQEENNQQAVEFLDENVKSEISSQLDLNEQEIQNQEITDAIAEIEKKVVSKVEQLQKEVIGNIPQEIEEPEINNKIDWAAIRAKLEKPLLNKEARFDLPLDVTIEQINVTDVSISQKEENKNTHKVELVSLLNVDSLKLQAEAYEQQVNLKQFDFKSDQGDLNATGSLLLKDNYPMQWQLDGSVAENAKVELPFNHINAHISGELYDKISLNLNTQGAIQAALTGNVELATERTPFALSLKSDEMTYPFTPQSVSTQEDKEPLNVRNVDVQIKGDLLQYNVNANANMQGMGMPASSVNLTGNGGVTHFQFQDLTLNTLDGVAQVEGELDWTKEIVWNTKFNLNNIKTKSVMPDWPAVLSGSFASKGMIGQDETWNAEIMDMNITGSLFQKDLQLKGNVSANDQQLLDIPALSFIYGENKVDLKGVLGEESDFYAEIKAPNLKGLLPNLKGKINGEVQLSGKATEPNIDLDLVAENVAYEKLKLQYLTAKGNIATNQTIQGDVVLGVRQFKYADINVEKATLTAKGSEADHTLKLTSTGNPVGVDLQLSGKFDRSQQIWEGQLNQMAIQSTEFGMFQTDKPVNVKYDNKAINANISAHCWHNPNLNVCFPTAFNAGIEGEVPLNIRRFDLAVLNSYLEENSQLSGIVDAKGNVAWFKNKQPEASIELKSNTITFLQKMEDGKRFPLTISPVKINMDMSDNNLALKSDFKLEDKGRFLTNVMVKDLSGSRTLSGSINIKQLSLKLIRPLLNRGDVVDGNINADLTLGGRASSPLLNGQLRVSDLKARSIIMPFDITDGNLVMNFHGNRSTLNGKIKNSQSELAIDGEADWRDLNAWKTKIHAKANRFKVDVPNIAKVAVSPDIQVTATPTLLTLSGNIDIPWARIEVEELPESAVKVSSDEVIMDGSSKIEKAFDPQQIPSQTSGGMAIDADIKINIGNDVKLKAYGLKSNVNGSLYVRQGKQGLGLYGKVSLDDGRFAAYGQDLLIRKGNITFTGAPSQPLLDIEAIRNPEAMDNPAITAGVRVNGLADNPTVKVFSDPVMSQNEVLSYILTGRALDSDDGSSSNAVAAALLSMSLSKSSKLVGDIGSTFGLKDLSVSTTGIGDNTKVEVRASLSPKFRVKYGVGIFAPLTELTLRYNLTPRLYLQWVSSINQAVDLMYRFEFDELF